MLYCCRRKNASVQRVLAPLLYFLPNLIKKAFNSRAYSGKMYDDVADHKDWAN